MDIPTNITIDLWFDLVEMCLLTKLITCWSNKCGEIFGRELVKFILIVLKRNILLFKLWMSDQYAHAQMQECACLDNFICLLEIRLYFSSKNSLMSLAHVFLMASFYF